MLPFNSILVVAMKIKLAVHSAAPLNGQNIAADVFGGVVVRVSYLQDQSLKIRNPGKRGLEREVMHRALIAELF